MSATAAATALGAVRTALFVPADATAKHAGAFAAGADAVILDLEDGVAPGAKDAARAALGASAELRDRSGSVPAIVRVNPPAGAAGRADLEALAPLGGADAVMVPKADREAVELVAAATALPQVALVETAAGVLAAAETAAHPAVARLMIGPVDLAAELGVEESDDGPELGHARGQVVLASAAAELPGPLDGPCLAIRDERALGLQLQRARRSGFTGKACIHPAQVAAVNAALTPGDEEAAWARQALERFQQVDGGVAALDGEMIDRPVALRARRILANYERNRR